MNNKYSAYSFDVFDTCISRTYEKPTDLFFHLGQLISPCKNKHISKNDFAEIFMKARITAEKKAYKANGRKKGCKMYEIYSLLEIPNCCNHSKFEIMQLEKKLELENSYPIKKIQSLVYELRDKKSRIIFISDMYLDNEFIKSLLIQHGFFLPQDSLYVSSDLYLTKKSGDLYKYVLQKENLQPSQLLHHGDNLFSDIIVAKEIGIDSIYVSDAEIRNNEIQFPESIFNPKIRRLNSIAKHIRLSENIDFSEIELKYFSTIAPILVSFTLWTLEKARELNIKRLYFVSRDGELPYKIAQLFQSSYPEIEVRYLYGSRRSWLLPSINENDSSWKLLAVPKNQKSSIADALERIGFNEVEISRLPEKLLTNEFDLHVELDSKTCAERLEQILYTSHFKKIMLEKIEIARNQSISYFKQEGMLESIKWSIVDVGWSLNAQAALKRIFSFYCPNIDITGLYFGISSKGLDHTITGDSHSFTKNRDFFFSRFATIEHAFLASMSQSTIGYELFNGKAYPRFGKNEPGAHSQKFAINLHKYLLLYAKVIAQKKSYITEVIKNRDTIEKNIESFFESPEKDILLFLSELPIFQDLRHEKKKENIHFSKISFIESISIAKGFFIKEKSKKYYWPEASAKISDNLPKIILYILLSLKKHFKRKYPYKN